METIAFLDSGIGGIPYLSRTKELLPAYRYVYYADTVNFPYGEQSADELRRIVHAAVDQIITRFAPKVIVLACNTASVVALESLRASFQLPFIGVVPAIRPAAKIVSEGTIAVLSTKRTAEDEYVSNLIKEYAPTSRVILVPAGGLVELVEYRWPPSVDGESGHTLAAAVATIQREGAQAVVLGCTHFVHLRREIAELLGPGIQLIDSVEGVCNQIVRVAGDPEPGASHHRDELVVTGSSVSEMYVALALREGLAITHGTNSYRPDR